MRNIHCSQRQFERLVDPALVHGNDDVCWDGDVGFSVEVEVWSHGSAVGKWQHGDTEARMVVLREEESDARFFVED